jgi:glycosyltransferase involved in cell wall biosynthesis
VSYFAKNGWAVDLITWHPPTSNSEIHPAVNIHRILFPPHSIARYGTLLEIIWLIRKIQPDIIHAHYIRTFGILAGLYSGLFGFRPIVVSAWGAHGLKRSKLLHRWLIKYALKKADCVHCDGENIIEVLTKLGAEQQKIKIIYFGTDVQKFNPEQRSEKLREELGIFDSPLVISLRNLTAIYDVESLITTIPIVLKEVPEAKFIIAGRGFQEAELKQLAKSLGVSDSIRFVGWISNDELPKYLASADIYVSTSLSDAGLAASTAEAMACGLPVVITDFGDNRKWVENGVNGFIVPLKDPKALAEKIIYLLKSPDIRKEFGMRNRKIIEERNNYYKEMEKMENIYIELIERYKS